MLTARARLLVRCPVRPQLLAEGEGRNEAVAVHPAIRMCIHRVSRGIYRSSGLVIVWRSTMGGFFSFISSGFVRAGEIMAVLLGCCVLGELFGSRDGVGVRRQQTWLMGRWQVRGIRRLTNIL